MEIELKVDPDELLVQDKLIHRNGKEKWKDFCLVCFSKVDPSKSPQQNGLLSNNLNVIFLLKNLLQVPSELLMDNFKKCGNPAFWISLCDNCSQLSSRAMEHHLQIMKLVNQLRTVVKIITDKMKESSDPCEIRTSYHQGFDDKMNTQMENRLHITRTREFVTNFDYTIDLMSPFIEGDKLARKLDLKKDSKILEEESTTDLDNNGDDWEENWQNEEHEQSEIKTPVVTDDNPSSKSPVKKSHVNVNGNWKCRHCDKLFGSKSSVCAHEKEKHAQTTSQFVCDICEKSVNSKSYLTIHRYMTHKLKVGMPAIIESQEGVSGGKSTNKDEAQTPNYSSDRYTQVNGKWKCRYCERLLGSKRSVRAHEHAIHPSVPEQFECDICGKKLNSKNYLISHRHKAHKVNVAGKPINSKPRKSQIIKADLKPRLSSNRTTKRHVQVNGKWKCRDCDKECKSRNAVWFHETEKHPSAPGQFICDICGKAMNSKAYLRTHLRNFHKVNTTGLPIIGNHPPIQKNEPRVKTENRRICHLCGKSFRWTYRLRRHLQYFHEKQFKLRCHVCGLGVYNSHSLKMHFLSKHKDGPGTIKLIEKGLKIWKCGVVGCKAQYLKEGGLEEHTRKVHREKDAQKRFTCSFCGKAFWYWHKLKCHESLHKIGSNKPYSCDVCGVKFKALGYVRKHKRRFHSLKYEQIIAL